MHNGLATKFLHGADGSQARLEPFVFLPATVVVGAEVVIIDLGGVAGDKVLIAPLATKIDDVGDAFIDPVLQLLLADFRIDGVEVATNGEPIVDVTKSPMPGRRL